ncbi:hypothetical protein E3E12_07800 [Formicincola oecophyllae]|uniref:Uncharacterized protein n=1 Tax=Formicincola oecophyllae TaxID=2558361 RepID=A0A4Y6U9F9_9PROT|nr:hypothetical protein [Formicincola oecophyllae]QDH14099.1 hypothetical protein E3E12_07800 [Formicincola oecophyllae]
MSKMPKFYFTERTHVNTLDDHNNLTDDIDLVKFGGHPKGLVTLNHEDGLELIDVTCLWWPKENGPFPFNVLLEALEMGEETLLADDYYDIYGDEGYTGEDDEETEDEGPEPDDGSDPTPRD